MISGYLEGYLFFTIPCLKWFTVYERDCFQQYPPPPIKKLICLTSQNRQCHMNKVFGYQKHWHWPLFWGNGPNKNFKQFCSRLDVGCWVPLNADDAFAQVLDRLVSLSFGNQQFFGPTFGLADFGVATWALVPLVEANGCGYGALFNTWLTTIWNTKTIDWNFVVTSYKLQIALQVLYSIRFADDFSPHMFSIQISESHPRCPVSKPSKPRFECTDSTSLFETWEINWSNLSDDEKA